MEIKEFEKLREEYEKLKFELTKITEEKNAVRPT